MRRFVFAFVLAATPASAEPPLFDDFQTFCVATRAEPEAIKQAVAAASGITPGGPISSGATDMEIWSHRVDGQVVFVGTSTTHDAADDKIPARDMQACLLRRRVNDEAGVAAIRNWVQVQPYEVSRGAKTTYRFLFQWNGDRRSAMPEGDDAQLPLDAAGLVWSLHIDVSDDNVVVELLHGLAWPKTSP